MRTCHSYSPEKVDAVGPAMRRKLTCCIMRSNAAIIETSQNKGGAVPGHTAANSVKHSSWKHGEGVYPASRGW